MAGFSNYLRNELLDHLFGKDTYSSPSNIYVALSTTAPSGDGSGVTEPSGNGYARASTDSADWSSASSFEIQNTSEISFPESTGSWGTITHFVLYDAASGGNMLAYGSLSASQSVAAGKTARFSSGALSVTH